MEVLHNRASSEKSSHDSFEKKYSSERRITERYPFCSEIKTGLILNLMIYQIIENFYNFFLNIDLIFFYK